MIVLFYFYGFFFKIDENLIRIIVIAGIPDFYIFRSNRNNNFGIGMRVFVVAAPQMLFIEIFKFAVGFFYNETFILGDAFNLDTAPAKSYLRIHK